MAQLEEQAAKELSPFIALLAELPAASTPAAFRVPTASRSPTQFPQPSFAAKPGSAYPLSL